MNANPADAKVSLGRSGLVLKATTFLMAVCLMSLICIHVIAFPPVFVFHVFRATRLLLFVLLLVNIGFAMLISSRKPGHLLMVLLVLVAFLGWLWIPKLIGDAQRQWFLQSGHQEYDRMVENVVKNRSLLASRHPAPFQLDSICGRPGVTGQLNEDGSLLLCFWGRGNDTMHGYWYYSGQMVGTRVTNVFCLPWVPRKYYLRLTNNWYTDLGRLGE
jgi:hypothetical protein